MTVVVWDGKSLAADRQITCGDTVGEASKLRKLKNGDVLAFSGTRSTGLILMDLYEKGRLVKEWPEFQTDKDDWSRLVVAHKDGTVDVYEQYPVALRLESPFCAWGVGREVALGALEMGASAEEAVLAANKWINGCGKGVDAIRVKR